MLPRNNHREKCAPYLDIEKLPSRFTVDFEELSTGAFPQVKVTINNDQAGDIIDDNSFKNDGYRYHDVFHYAFATLLGWSPCTRAMLKRKRKSNLQIDRIEDGARATITEEAISLMIFSEARSKDFFKHGDNIDDSLLEMIKKMTSDFEVRDKSKEEWKNAIIKSYEMFRLLTSNKGGTIMFNSSTKKITYQAPKQHLA